MILIEIRFSRMDDSAVTVPGRARQQVLGDYSSYDEDCRTENALRLTTPLQTPSPFSACVDRFSSQIGSVLDTGNRSGLAPITRLRRLLTLFVLALLPLASWTTASAVEKKVLFLYADKSNGGMVAYREVVQSAMRAGSPDRITFYEEYMDLSQYPGDEYLSLLRGFYHQKYQGQRFDLIIAQAGSVLNFLTKYGEELFPGTPTVFGTLEKNRIEGLKLGPNITGILTDVGFGATLEAALKMQPDARNVVVVSGTSEVDAKHLAKARSQFRSFEARVEFTYLTGLPMEELEKRLANLPEHTIIFYVTLFRDGADHAFTLMDSVARVARASSVPTYSVIDRLIEAGSIGGFVMSLEADGKDVAKVALRVLAGEKPADIPIRVADTNRYMFDWRQLRHWNIDERRLPPGSVLMFREPTLWELYKWRIVAVISLCVLQAALIVWLLITRNKRRRAEEAKNSLAAIVESSDDAILSKALDGTITSWNAGAEKIYGYSASEMLGHKVWRLVPTERHEEILRILDQIRRGQSVDHLETVRVTKDGRRIDVSLTVSPIRDDHGVVIGASAIARDITERNRDGKILQQLSGQLLMLQDEEHRRIAAELHDGLGQSLAIIKNRALMGMREQINQSQIKEQFQEIAETATSSILEVRGIAHNLRPYELDRLGLVAAIESMIDRVSASTSIRITGDLNHIDGLLSPEAETSVYRMIQEGLNNVVRHSNAATARIEVKNHLKSLIISVQDNGKGISRSTTNDNGNHVGGFGLVGIAERVRLLGGSLSIDSQPMCGTTITVRLEMQSVAAE